MPECVMSEVKVKLSEKEREVYDRFKRELVVSLKGEEIDAGNAAALSGKLSQMAMARYNGENKRVLPIHERKLDALEDLIEAANGKPVLSLTGQARPRTDTGTAAQTPHPVLPAGYRESVTAGIGVSCPSRLSTRGRRAWSESAGRGFDPDMVRLT
jgi:hypothetical protein